MSNFYSPEVVGRGSETQLRVGENLKVFLRYMYGSFLGDFVSINASINYS